MMLFQSFEEQKKSGCSAYVEIQFCKMKSDTDIKNIVSVCSINFRKYDSLYIYLDDIDTFIEEYRNIFNCGIYSNLESGVVDIYGINYYKPDMAETLIAMILESQPTDYEILIGWLNKAKNYNGFYILGI